MFLWQLTVIQCIKILLFLQNKSGSCGWQNNKNTVKCEQLYRAETLHRRCTMSYTQIPNVCNWWWGGNIYFNEKPSMWSITQGILGIYFFFIVNYKMTSLYLLPKPVHLTVFYGKITLNNEIYWIMYFVADIQISIILSMCKAGVIKLVPGGPVTCRV